MPSIALTARLLLATVFLVAGFAKWRAPARLAVTLGALSGASLRVRTAAARVVASVEVALGVWLVSGLAVAAAAVAASAVLVCFVTVVVVLARRAPGVPCGCFGESEHDTGVLSGVARNAALIAAAVVLATHTADQPSDLQTFAGAVTVVIGLTSAHRILTVVLEQRARLFSPVR